MQISIIIIWILATLAITSFAGVIGRKYGVEYIIAIMAGLVVTANILANKIADCLSYGGKLNSKLFNDTGNFNENFKSNFVKECTLNFGVEDFEDWKTEEQYYAEVNFFTLANANNAVFSFSNGNANWKESCEIKKDGHEDYEKLPKCVKRRFYSLDQNNEQYLIEILSIVGKTEKNVK